MSVAAALKGDSAPQILSLVSISPRSNSSVPEISEPRPKKTARPANRLLTTPSPSPGLPPNDAAHYQSHTMRGEDSKIHSQANLNPHLVPPAPPPRLSVPRLQLPRVRKAAHARCLPRAPTRDGSPTGPGAGAEGAAGAAGDAETGGCGEFLPRGSVGRRGWVGGRFSSSFSAVAFL